MYYYNNSQRISPKKKKKIQRYMIILNPFPHNSYHLQDANEAKFSRLPSLD